MPFVIRAIFTVWWVPRGAHLSFEVTSTAVDSRITEDDFVNAKATNTFSAIVPIWTEKTTQQLIAQRMNSWILKRIIISGQVIHEAAADWLDVVIFHCDKFIIRFYSLFTSIPIYIIYKSILSFFPFSLSHAICKSWRDRLPSLSLNVLFMERGIQFNSMLCAFAQMTRSSGKKKIEYIAHTTTTNDCASLKSNQILHISSDEKNSFYSFIALKKLMERASERVRVNCRMHMPHASQTHLNNLNAHCALYANIYYYYWYFCSAANSRAKTA